MIPNDTPQSLETTPNVATVGFFRITDTTQARILQSLSDKMYTRKQLAVIREYCNNANDAHIVVGKPTNEVIVTLPTDTNPVFSVRDFGAGLSKDQIRDVYCVLGESTKRNSPTQNGVLGYGCKAGFAEADSFTVTSWNGGEKAIYNCIKGDTQKLHSVVELFRGPSDEPTGIEVSVPVKVGNIYTFQREAVHFFKHWRELPTIHNMDSHYELTMNKFRNTPAVLSGEGWSVRRKSESSAEGVAFMGGVPYRIDWNVLNARMAIDAQKRVLFDILQNNDVTFTFEMGELQFVDSREGLEYTDLTLDALTKRMESIFDKIKEAFQSKFADAANIWDAKKIYNSLFNIGVLEVERGEESDSIEHIRILDGNMSRLEIGFKGMFQWNGIVIDSPYFNDINRFDNANTSKMHGMSWTPSIPVMTTYRKKKNRAKVIPCNGTASGRCILASDKVAIVVNDMGAKSGQSMIARYLLLSEKVRTVHFLSFADDTIRKAFYDEYHFESVPVRQMSDLIGPAKKWNSANKVSRSYGGGGGGTRPMYYFDIDSQTVLESEVPASEIEEGAFYVEVGEGRRQARMIRMPDGSLNAPDDVVSEISTLIDKLDLDIDKVYIINNQVKDAKWFNQAVMCGEWIKFWEYVKEHVTANLNIQSLVDSQSARNCAVFHGNTVEAFRGKIIEPSSPIHEYISTWENVPVDNGLIRALDAVNLWARLSCGVKSNPIYKEIREKIFARYPYLPGNASHMLSNVELERLLFYINASDTYIELTKPVEQTTEVSA